MLLLIERFSSEPNENKYLRGEPSITLRLVYLFLVYTWVVLKVYCGDLGLTNKTSARIIISVSLDNCPKFCIKTCLFGAGVHAFTPIWAA